jgi:hypothetical protein
MERITNKLFQKIAEFNPTISPNSTRDIKIILASIKDFEKYEWKGIQSKLHYVNFDTNLDEVVNLMNKELIEQENELLGEKTILIRRSFPKDITELFGVTKECYRATQVIAYKFDPTKGGFPVFAYASVSIK